MDFFRGRSPPNFISICLDNQNSNETQAPSNPVLEIPVESSQLQVPTEGTQLDTPTEQDSGQLNFATLATSPGSIDSQPDVNVYADAMVQRLKSSQTPAPSAGPEQVSAGLSEAQEPREQKQSTPLSSPKLASTCFRPIEAVPLDNSLTQLESTLRVAATLRTQLPELLPAHDLSREHSDLSNLQSNEDNDSSVYKIPALPSGETRVRFLADLSETEKTTEETSHVDLPVLYGNNPIASESGTEGGDELDPQGAIKQALQLVR